MHFIKKLKNSDTHRDIIKAFIFCMLFLAWTILNRVFLFLPPMLGMLFIIFMNVYQQKNSTFIFAIVICLVIFESENQLPLGILSIIFLVLNHLITKKFNLIFGQNPLFIFLYIGALYLSYILVMYIIKMFGSGTSFNVYPIFIAYFLCESLIGLFYEYFRD